MKVVKTIAMIFVGFVAGIVSICALSAKAIKTITKSDTMVKAIKNSICDYIETLLFGSTRETIRKRSTFKPYSAHYTRLFTDEEQKDHLSCSQ